MPLQPRIGIIICTFNRRVSLLACLEALSRQDYPAGLLSVWVHDDGSSDGTPEAAAARIGEMLGAGWGGGEVFSSGSSAGIARGRNEGARRALPVSDLLLFVDDDVIPDPGCVSGLVARMSALPGAGLAAPLILRSDNGRPLHAPYFVGGLLFRYSAGDPRLEVFCDWVDPACVLVSAAAFSAAGGFWPGYYRSHEGTDFCLRAGKAGFKVLYSPSVSAVHTMRAENLSPDRLYYLYRNKFTLIRRNAGALHRALLVPLLALAVLPKYLLDSLLRRGGMIGEELSAIISAVADGVMGKEGPRGD